MKRFFGLVGALLLMSIATVSASGDCNHSCGGWIEDSVEFHKVFAKDISFSASTVEATSFDHHHSSPWHESSTSFSEASSSSVSVQKSFAKTVDFSHSFKKWFPFGCWWGC